MRERAGSLRKLRMAADILLAVAAQPEASRSYAVRGIPTHVLEERGRAALAEAERWTAELAQEALSHG